MNLKSTNFNILSYVVCAFLFSCQVDQSTTGIDLTGQWSVKLDPEEKGETEEWFALDIVGQPIRLPSTLDDAQIGKPNGLKPELNNYVLSHLTRKNSYTGKAWYQLSVSIPGYWKGKNITLKLERVLWQSQVWIDDQKVEGKQESLVTPHYFNLSGILTPGEHRITVLVDNSDFYPDINVAGDKYPAPEDKDMAHAYTNHTQIKWNGILGDLLLEAKPKIHITETQVYTKLDLSKVRVETQLSQKTQGEAKVEIVKDDVVVASTSVLVDGDKFTVEFDAENLDRWDEFNPTLYECRVNVAGSGRVVPFGIRNISNKNAELAINGQRSFMRGNLECVIFPLTGRPPLRKEGWKSLMDSAKAYGLNHLRFHSWCPPKAAFEVADELGLYLQVELPLWNLSVGTDHSTDEFLQREAKNIIREYGNHPSFVFFSVGNELEGNLDWLNGLIADMKIWDDRHLYTTTTFSFQKDAGAEPQPEDEFFVTQWTNRGWVRGQGVFNQQIPSFSKNYSANMGHIEVPLISHEIGQYSVYPDLSEIPKYTGVLTPLNFLAVKKDLEQKGLINLAPDFTLASSKLAALLYKEEIERALRTPEFDGFQLLQLQDFPGQGTALVGLLNAFWESKGAVTAEEFRQFCSPVVPLLSFEKAVFESGETFEANVQIANFKKTISDGLLRWYISDGDQVLKEGQIVIDKIEVGNENVIGKISEVLQVESASKVEIGLEIVDTNIKNKWNIWVYPKTAANANEVLYTRSLHQAKKALKAGETVFFNPDFNTLKGVKGRFVPVFWSPVHFPDQPATMGILCDPAHPALADFPTDFHSDWQWWDLNINSKAMILDDMNIDPIIRVIDNFVTNRSLGSVFEAQVGDGKLIVSSIDLNTDLDNRIVARQMRISLLNYMTSNDFNPKQTLALDQLDAFLDL